MNAEILFKKDGTPTHAVICGKCGLVYAHGALSTWTDHVAASEMAERLANDCCTQIVCEGGCGRELGPKNKGGLLRCTECRRRNEREADLKRANSDKVTRYALTDVPKDVFVFQDDTFFPDVDTFLAAAEDVDWEPKDFPAVLWLCVASKPYIDADTVIENFEENLELGDGVTADDVCKDIGDLRTAMDAFNDKQTASLWHQRTDACVLVTAADIGIEWCNECEGDGESSYPSPAEPGKVCASCGGTGRANQDGA